MTNVEREMGRLAWEQPQYQCKENNNNIKTHGARADHTYRGNVLIIERTSPQLWTEKINIWEQHAIRNWQVNDNSYGLITLIKEFLY